MKNINIYIYIYIPFFSKYNYIIILFFLIIIIWSEMANQGRKLPQPPEGSTF